MQVSHSLEIVTAGKQADGRLLTAHLKFSAVLGTPSPYRPIVIRPMGSSPMVMSRNTFLVTGPPGALAMALTACRQQELR